MPVFIHENHNEVLQSIYKCIGSKHLPLNDNLMIHFDSHPDLCCPDKMPASYVWDKNLLFEAINIESWIIPAVFSGQISQVAWVKPDWAPQIPEGRHKVLVGEAEDQIFVDSRLDYFVSEGVCRRDLANAKTLSLDVISMKEKELSFKERLLERYILDIDLDFFSTKNPFLEIYAKANMYEALKDIYILPEKYDPSDDEAIAEYSARRREHLGELGRFFSHLDEGKSLESFPGKISDQLGILVNSIKRSYPDEKVDWMLVHNAGCTCDEIPLPHHVSTRKEITDSMALFESFLRNLDAPPTIVTISRSSSDDYCPADQVDFIQSQVITILERVFHSIDPKLEYLSE